MNLADILVMIIVVLCVAASLVLKKKLRKKGGGCPGCSGSCPVHCSACQVRETEDGKKDL